MFILLTGTNTEQVLVNLNLVTAITCVQGNNTVYFIGGDYVEVAESIEEIHEMIKSAEKRYRK
jgi:uncharacterized protein YlzI (FlbEa/FlbD family)